MFSISRIAVAQEWATEEAKRAFGVPKDTIKDSVSTEPKKPAKKNGKKQTTTKANSLKTATLFYKEKANESVKKFAAMVKKCMPNNNKSEYKACLESVVIDWQKNYSKNYSDVPYPLITGNDLANGLLKDL